MKLFVVKHAHGRIHHTTREGRPLCGGGNGGRLGQWQAEIGPANCRACLLITTGQNNAKQRRPRPDMPVI